jgi:FixJ family two-component response regulator
MVSGAITKERVLELIKYDVCGFIEKPFLEEDVKGIVDRAFNISQLNTLLSKSINYILYQFSDLDSYLKQIGKENIRVTLKEELKNIIKIQNELTEKKKAFK